MGCACARECAAAGLRTALIEASVPGGAATGAAMGHIVVLDDSPAQLALTRYSRSLWYQQAQALPDAVAYRSPGTLWIAADDEERAECCAKQARFAEADVESRILTSSELAHEEPNLRPGLAGGLLVPDDGVLNPAAAASFYLEEATKLGARLFLSRAISAGQGQVQLADGTRLTGQRIILAVGTESDLLPALPIRRRKGHLALTEPAPGFLRHQLVELGYLKSAHDSEADSVAFNVQPRATGQVLIGSSRQYGSENTEVEPEILRTMLERAATFMPHLPELPIVRTWAGLRAATADKLPLLGPASGLSDDPTLYLAAGFEGLGITTAPGAARLLVDGMLGRMPAIDPTPYLPARMGLQHEPGEKR